MTKCLQVESYAGPVQVSAVAVLLTVIAIVIARRQDFTALPSPPHPPALTLFLLPVPQCSLLLGEADLDVLIQGWALGSHLFSAL